MRDTLVLIHQSHLRLVATPVEINRSTQNISFYLKISWVELVKVSLEFKKDTLMLIKEEEDSWMSATERLAIPLYTEKSNWYWSRNAWKVQF